MISIASFWPGVCGQSSQLGARLFVSAVERCCSSSFPVHICECMCVCLVCVRACVSTHPCLIHAVLFRALQLQFLSLYITFFLSFLVYFCSFPLPFSFCFFFFSFLFFYLLAVLLALAPMPRPLLWHRGWLCPIRSAAGEGGEWDAGSSESGAGSHHTVLRPWNVSGTTTTNRAASLSPLLFATWLRQTSHWNKPVPARSKSNTKRTTVASDSCWR